MRGRLSLSQTLLLLGRLAVAAIFLFAAYSKLLQPTTSLATNRTFFALQVDSYQLLPQWAVMAVASSLPWFELALGLALAVGYPLRAAAAMASLLLLGFFGVMLRTYFKGLQINCGCFGPGETLGVKTLVRDGLLLAISLAVTLGAFLSPREKATEAQLPESAQTK
jgi:uncharacterized membrane protein YphA (DoxX/SURF4 family)